MNNHLSKKTSGNCTIENNCRFCHTCSISVILLLGKEDQVCEQSLSSILKQTIDASEYELWIIDSYNHTNYASFGEKYVASNQPIKVLSSLIQDKIQGKYTVIVHAGEILSKFYLSKMLQYANRVNPNELEIDDFEDDEDDVDDATEKKDVHLPPIPLVCPKHMQYTTKQVVRFSSGKKIVGVDLRANNCSNLRFPLSLHGVFLKSEILKKYTFNADLSLLQAETDVLFRILMDSRLLLAVNTIEYTYETTEINAKTIKSFLAFLTDWLLPFIKSVAKPHSKKIPVFLQAYAMHQILLCLDNSIRESLSLSKIEFKQFLDTLTSLVFYIDDNTIDRLIPNDTFFHQALNIYLIQIKHNAIDSFAKLKELNRSLLLSFGVRKSFLTSNQTPIFIQDICLKDDKVCIQASFFKIYDREKVSMILRHNLQETKILFDIEKMQCFTHPFFDFYITNIEIPFEKQYKENILGFELEYTSKRYPIPVSLALKNNKKTFLKYDQDTYQVFIKAKALKKTFS